ncbi:MAG TPA: hypothetical protein VJ850_00050, partial [Candidatus Limnocylindrales bacterium]|nr:hypothetical protein [Candidatus Limnocylindrales bacterium]
AEASRVAGNFVRWAREHFAVDADYTDASIDVVESIASKIDEDIRLRRASPDPSFAEAMAPGFGFYIGETYLKNHGGSWGWSDVPDGIRTVAVQTPNGGLFWPALKSLKRLLREPGEDLRYYYTSVCLKV